MQRETGDQWTCEKKTEVGMLSEIKTGPHGSETTKEEDLKMTL